MKETAEVPVLMYHRVGQAHNAWEARFAISPGKFAAHMHALSRRGYRAVDTDALVSWLEGGPALNHGALVITFDDGFRGVRDHALSVMEELGWPFAVFLVSDLIGGHDEWTRNSNPRGTAYPLLNLPDIHDMQRRGVSFHSHTRSHASLPGLDEARLADQLAGSHRVLSELLGCDVRYVAYPYGDLNDRVEAATRAAGYRAAFSAQSGFNQRDVNRYRIRRIEVFGTDTPAMVLRKLKFGCNDGSLAYAARHYFNRLRRRMAEAAG